MTTPDIKVYVDVNHTKKLLRVRIDNEAGTITVCNAWGNQLVIYSGGCLMENQTINVVCSGYTLRHYMQSYEEYYPGYIPEVFQLKNFNVLLKLAFMNV